MNEIQTISSNTSHPHDNILGDHYRTGDFPPIEYPVYDPQIIQHNPSIWQIPQKIDVIGPTVNPSGGWVNIDEAQRLWQTNLANVTVDSATQWRITVNNDSIIAAVDMAGVKPEDVIVEVVDGHIIRAQGRRFDTQAAVVREYKLGQIYDAKTAAATLEAGVLTVVVLRAKTTNAHKVPVTIK